MSGQQVRKPPSRIRRWVRWGFLTWAVFSTTWVANTMRTRGVDAIHLESSRDVSVVKSEETLAFVPRSPKAPAGLLFICGAGVAAQAYAPLLRPIAESGYPVFIVRLPWRFAPYDSHKETALARARDVITTHPGLTRWVVAGHSLGGKLAGQFAGREEKSLAALVLIGTTHPRDHDLSSLTIPVTKVYGTNDGVAPPDRMFANRLRLPPHTRWVEVKGGNHSQFGHYGRQLMDGAPAISREAQQAITREVLLESLAR